MLVIAGSIRIDPAKRAAAAAAALEIMKETHKEPGNLA
jgi:quinol monooxygenase YgiN